MAIATTGGLARPRDAAELPPEPGQTDNALASQTVIPVDHLAASDDDRIRVINKNTREAGGKGVPAFEFANRVYTISTPIYLYSGLKLLGSAGLPAREYGGGTTIRWTGRPDSSVFEFPPEGQTGAELSCGRVAAGSIDHWCSLRGWSTDRCFPKVAHDCRVVSWAHAVVLQSA